MKITIFGSTGGTGKLLVQKALDRGHSVTAFARTPDKLGIQNERLSLYEGDVRNSEAVSHSLRGADGVISALGPGPGSPDDLMAIAATNIVNGMTKNGVERLIWSTGAGVRAPGDDPTLMHKTIEFLLKLISGKTLENSLRGVRIIQDSGLKWTVARAPMLTNEPGESAYQVSYVNENLGRTLSRENFARWMLDLLESEEWLQDMPAASDRK